MLGTELMVGDCVGVPDVGTKLTLGLSLFVGASVKRTFLYDATS